MRTRPCQSKLGEELGLRRSLVSLELRIALPPDVHEPLVTGFFVGIQLSVECVDLRVCAAGGLVVVGLPVADVCRRKGVS